MGEIIEKTRQYLDKIKEEKDLNAFLFVSEEDTAKRAEEIESMPEDKPLKGMVLAIKDNIMLENWPATAASKILENHMAIYDATVIKKLRDAGAIFVGKTNMDEFAMGSSTENSAYGPTKNPWDTERVPGGSSGGSAVAVASDMCDASLGSDTAGSIRQPAALCGVTGFKPTYGTVSRYGLMAMASSFDQIGPFAKNADDAEKIFKVISGKDEMDQTTVDYTYEPVDVDLSNLKIGLPKQLWEVQLDDDVKSATKDMVEFYKSKGAQIIEVDLPSVKYWLPTYYIITPAEVSSNLARYDGIRYGNRVEKDTLQETYLASRQAGFGPESKRRILLGTFVLSIGHFDDYYNLAIKTKQKITEEFKKAFEQVDVMISPTMATGAFKIGEKIDDPLTMYACDILTVGANLGGLPALSVPVGVTQENLPIGGQIIGKSFEDNVILSLAKQYQAETDFHLKKPKGTNG